jgi:hypothetical protein
MKWLIFGAAAYFGLQYLRDQQLNAAIAACGGVGSAGSLDCPGYLQVQQKWAWFPSLTKLGGV